MSPVDEMGFRVLGEDLFGRDIALARRLGKSGGLDTSPPRVTGFAATSPAIGTTITITTFTASEAGVYFLITESSTPPAPGAAGWSLTAPASYVSTSGSCTLYPWVKDVAGNVSAVYGSPVAVEVYEVPAYANAGGTGDRTASITASTTQAGGASLPNCLINGTPAEGGNAFFSGGVAVAGKEIKFVLPNKAVITEAKFYTIVNPSGTWKWQGSNNGTVWTDIGGTFTLSDAHPQTQATLSGNATGYSQYRLLGVAGSIGAGGTFAREMEFKIGNLLP